MSDPDATKDEKKTEEASGELTNDQQVIDQVETENQAEKELQDDEEATEIPKIEDGHGKINESKTSKFSMKFAFSIPLEKLKLFGFKKKYF